MAVNPRVLSSFLTDALRLSGQANQAVQALVLEARKGELSPAKVQHLYRVIHTLKGTASMVHGCEKVVNALHRVEGRLATNSLEDSARDRSWLVEAREAVAQSHEALLEIQNQAKASTPVRSETSLKGILARTVLGEREELLWFPLSSVVRVLAPDVLSDRDVMCVQGTWVPVLGGARETSRRCVGLVAQSETSTAVVAAHEIVSVVSWTIAAQQGAKAGIDFVFGSPAAAATEPASPGLSTEKTTSSRAKGSQAA